MTDATTPTQPDEQRGIYGKYKIERIGGTPGKHDGCWYFVLDKMHDPYAIPALSAYADACRAQYPELAADLDRIVAVVHDAVMTTPEQPRTALRNSLAVLRGRAERGWQDDPKWDVNEIAACQSYLDAIEAQARPAVTSEADDDYRDRHERAMRDHILGAGDKAHTCDDLCSDAILDRLAGKTPSNEYPPQPQYAVASEGLRAALSRYGSGAMPNGDVVWHTPDQATALAIIALASPAGRSVGALDEATLRMYALAIIAAGRGSGTDEPWIVLRKIIAAAYAAERQGES